MDVVVQAGESLITGLISTLITNFIEFGKKKYEYETNKKDIQEILEEERNFIEKELLSYAEIKMKMNSNFFTDILSNYTFSNSLFNEINFDSLTKNIIEKKLKNINYSKNLSHLNILLLGKDQRGKNSIINSILEKNTPEQKSEECILYSKNEFKFFDFQLTNQEGIQIEKAIELIKKSYKGNNPEEYIHCICFCIFGDGLDEYTKQNLIKIIKFYDFYNLPLIVINCRLDKKLFSKEISAVINQNTELAKLNSYKNLFRLSLYIKNIKDYFEFEEISSIKDTLSDLKNNYSSFFYKMKLIIDYENEINHKNSDYKKMIESRTNEFLIGNQISNMCLLNKQILYKIISKLLEHKEIDSNLKNLIYELFKDFQKYISSQFTDKYYKFLGDKSKLLNDFKTEINKRNYTQNEVGQFLLLTEKSISNDKKKKGNKKDEKNGTEITFIEKVHILYNSVIIKKSSVFIDNKIVEELSKKLIESFINKVNSLHYNKEKGLEECIIF